MNGLLQSETYRSIWVTIAIACIPLVPTTIILVVQQIKNNEHQNAAIENNSMAISRIYGTIYSEPIPNTPLGRRTQRVEDRLDVISMALAESMRHIEAIDTIGTRSLVNVTQLQARSIAQQDRMSERLNIIDQRLATLEATVKAMQEAR